MRLKSIVLAGSFVLMSFLSLSAFAASAPAEAVETSSSGESLKAFIITPGVAFYRYADKRHIENEWMGTLSLGYRFSKCVSAELLYGRISSNQNTGDKQNVRGNLFTLNGLYYFRVEHKLNPYVLGGLGFIHISPPTSTDPSTQAL